MKKIMKKSLLLVTGIIICAMFSMPSLAADRPIRLKMTTYYMNKHPVYKFAYEPWIKEIKKRTNGRVIITFYNPNTIVPPAEVLNATLKGQVDIGGTLCGRNPGVFPLATVTSKIPNITSSTLATSLTAWELLKTTPAIQEEFKGLKMFALHHSAPSQLVTKNEPATKISQIKGLRLACPTKDSFAIGNGLGANMIMQPGREMYLALSRNMAEGVIYPIPPLRSFKINEATKYTILFDFFSAPMWLAMNQAKWDSLPPEIQKVFEETTGDVMTERIGEALDKGVDVDTETMKKAGMKFMTPSSEEKELASTTLTPILKKVWLDELASAKCTYSDLEGLYDKAVALMKKNEEIYGRR